MSSPVRLAAQPIGARAVPGESQAALDRCIDRVREQAFAAGRAAAQNEDRASAVTALDAAAERIELALEEALPAVVEDVTWLATEIAQHLLRSEIQAGRYDLETVVRSTLEASGAGRCACTVHLHPDDVAALEDVVFRAGTKIEPDVEVRRGDVHVTTPRGLMVREVDAAVGVIREALRSSTQ